MNEEIKAWLWLTICAGAWLVVSVLAAEADWSCEVMFCASLAAFIFLRFESRGWVSEKANNTSDGGCKLFGKLALVSLPFVVLSMIARWELDGELADWTVGRILQLQSLAATLHLERRLGYLMSGVSLAFAMAIIYFAATRRFEAIDRMAASQKSANSLLGVLSAIVMALATFSIVAGPASSAISHLSERRASEVLARVDKAVQQHDLAWRVLVGRYLAMAVESEPVDEDQSVNEALSVDSEATDQECVAQDPADTTCSLGAYLEDVFVGENLEPIPPPDPAVQPGGGMPLDTGNLEPFAKGLLEVARHYTAMGYPHDSYRAPQLASVSDLPAGGIIEATAEFCNRVICKSNDKGLTTDLVRGSADVTTTRFGKVMRAVFDAILPIVGFNLPEPKLSESMAPAFQDVVGSVTKDPLKATLRDLTTRGMHFLVQHCGSSDACYFEDPLEEQVRNALHETPGWKTRLVAALIQRWSRIRPATRERPGDEGGGGRDDTLDGFCECVTTRNGIPVSRRTGRCEILRLTCRSGVGVP